MSRYLLIVCLLLGGASPLVAQEAPLLIDGEIYDLLTLKETDEDPETTLKLEPLPLEPREPVRRKDAEQSLILRLLNRPQLRYEVKWKYIKQVRLFEELVLEEAAELVEAERFDAAYDCYNFVSQRSPEFPGLADALTNCLFAEAKFWRSRDRYDQALALANRAYQRNAEFEGLSEFLGELVEKLIQDQVQARNFTATRRLLLELEQKFPQHPTLQRWRNVLTGNAQKYLDAAEASKQAGDLGKAHRAIYQAVRLWPKLKGAVEFYQSLQDEYPLVSVAVADFGPVGPARDWKSLTNWQVRRVSGLTNRLLVEPEGYTATGFRYTQPLGNWKPLGGSALFQWNGGWKYSGSSASVTGFDVASRLMSRADPSSRIYHPAWAQLLARVKQGEGVTIDFKHQAARPEAYLQLPLVPWNHTPSSTAPLLGAYQVQAEDESSRQFKLREDAANPDPQQPREMVERTYSNASEAVELLISGRVAAWDRVPPWEWDRVQRYEELELKPYASPTVHLLLPNFQTPLMQQREFRKALFHGIHRDRILNETIFQGENVGGASLLPGPFPQGYGSPGRMAANDYNPQLMLGLLNAAYQEEQQRTGRDRSEDPLLVLAYPKSLVAQRACREIKRFLELGGEGLEIELLELPSGQAFPTNSQHWDLLYLEWTALEPQDAAWRLFGPGGLLPFEHPLKSVVFQRLSQAEDLDQVSAALQLLDRIAQEERLVIPLWQLTEYFAHHQRLSGSGEVPVTLYQNVKNWRLSPAIPAE